MSSVDWFSYFLHPGKLQSDFGVQSTAPLWTTALERREMGVHVLQGLLGTNNFREFVLSAYPSLGDLHGQQQVTERYSGPTPPSTPLALGSSIGDGGDINSARRIGQCSRFTMSPESGLPAESLATVLKSNNLPALSNRQERLLNIADNLTTLIGFEVEEVELAVHATIRFIYYMHLLENSNVGEHQYQYRRWTVRAAYREEEVGLTMEVGDDPALEFNCNQLLSHIQSLDESDSAARLIKFKTSYDLARIYLAQSHFTQALNMFRECQRIDPQRCKPDKFGLQVGQRSKPSVDEYVDACTTIVQPTDTNGLVQSLQDKSDTTTSLATAERDTKHITALIDARDYDQALKQNLLVVLDGADWDSVAINSFVWMLRIHPRLLGYCTRLLPADAQRTSRMLAAAAAEWAATKTSLEGQVSAPDTEALQRCADAIATFITDSTYVDPPTSADSDGTVIPAAEKQGTMVENQVQGQDSLSLDTSRPALAMVQLSYCYLSGLRLLEKEQYKSAQIWFARGMEMAQKIATQQQQPQQHQQAAVMAQTVEKDKALRTALEAQVTVHARLADLYRQIAEGADVNDLSTDIDAIMEAQAPIRFEFLERLVTVCLRQDTKEVFTKLVSTIATNQKLYQQLPEIHITLLQIASLLVVIRDILTRLDIDISREMGTDSTESFVEIPAEELEKLQKAVADMAMLLLKIPTGSDGNYYTNYLRNILGCIHHAGTKHENEIERFCRMWGDPVYLTLLGTLMAEIVQAGMGTSVTGTSRLCKLLPYIVQKEDPNSTYNTDEGDERMSVDPSTHSITEGFINNSTDQGRKNMKHMRAVTLLILKYAIRATPTNATTWLYFSAVTQHGEHLDTLFMPLFLEHLALLTTAFEPELIRRCVGEDWFQQRLPAMIHSLVEHKMSGAAVVLHQCAIDINYSAAIPLVVKAFEKEEIAQAVAAFFWDPDIIEYAQYLGKMPSCSLDIEFVVPSEELGDSRPLILSSYFRWLSGLLSTK
ncbi:hypothetical protein COEREDRAFT_5517 [Coemansia reversa NRRL 1564]|uniref:Uncharacterized protein n=1 Tax=Coemansia reversa (strain ATCC 12441 / NRRL 1564) TaxID=763665 RepID=A0A2G5BL12_COERN|nr:hypothetical protein COEREDRAFT_5517 [Coemansia reversa NRRL 1564]|eukprot:PIA19705.1 hypothetical protein COEREDRAFT_5517 [Coemansia reversa NRRL 1564]